MKTIYIVLSILGVVVPSFFFLPWLEAHGLAVALLAKEAVASPVSAFAWADVLVSGVALLCFIAHEHRKRKVPYVWLPVIGLFSVGVSLALPLFLALREASSQGAR